MEYFKCNHCDFITTSRSQIRSHVWNHKSTHRKFNRPLKDHYETINGDE